MKQQHGALSEWQPAERLHEFSFLFGADEQIERVRIGLGRNGREIFEEFFVAVLLSPSLNAFLMRDAKKPTAELLIVAQAAEVRHGTDKRLLHDIQAGLLFTDQFEYINI